MDQALAVQVLQRGADMASVMKPSVGGTQPGTAHPRVRGNIDRGHTPHHTAPHAHGTAAVGGADVAMV